MHHSENTKYVESWICCLSAVILIKKNNFSFSPIVLIFKKSYSTPQVILKTKFDFFSVYNTVNLLTLGLILKTKVLDTLIIPLSLTQVGLEEKFGKDRVFNTPLCEQVENCISTL